jgi:glyoxylase-like metal-dependent hydrolase (beta-lactamase superfamily II)
MNKGEKHLGPVWFIPGDRGGRYPFCHSVYIEGAGILIDPASDRKRLMELRKDPGVNTVWLSHWHEDHLMHLDLFDDLPLCISEKDAAPISDLGLFMDAYGMEDPAEREYWEDILTRDFHFRPRSPARFLKAGETIALGGLDVDIIGSPGHTPGHLAFLFREPGVLFMGDYDLTSFGPWYGDVESSIRDTITSVRRLKKVQARTWITGHETGLFEQEPGELWEEYLDVIARREDRLVDLLEEPRTLEEIVGAWIIYGKPREPKAFYEFGERAHMKKHLEDLMGQGRVFLDGDRYCLNG